MKIDRQALVDLGYYALQFCDIRIVPSGIHAICQWSLRHEGSGGHKHFIHDSELFGMLRNELFVV